MVVRIRLGTDSGEPLCGGATSRVRSVITMVAVPTGNEVAGTGDADGEPAGESVADGAVEEGGAWLETLLRWVATIAMATSTTAVTVASTAHNTTARRRPLPSFSPFRLLRFGRSSPVASMLREATSGRDLPTPPG